MHTVIEELCTGCDLSLPPCPVDCIDIVPPTPRIEDWRPPIPLRLAE
jgi:electron transport complex protein RnfB